MPSIHEHQEQDQQNRASTSHQSNVADSIRVEPPSSSQVEAEYHTLATQTATLDLEDQDVEPNVSSKDDKDTWSDEDAPPETDDENSEPEPAHATATAPANSVQADQSKPKEDVKNADNAATSKDANPEDDETNTPRFQTYVSLHNEMMTSKTALTTDTTELINHYNHASRLARILLSSHEKHDDVPLVIHAQACLVLGCSDEDDCYERMEDAVWLLNHAMEEGALGKEQGQAMIETCEAVMGMRGQRIGASDDEDVEEDGEDEGDEDGQAENDSLDESKGENTGDGEDYEKNGALP